MVIYIPIVFEKVVSNINFLKIILMKKVFQIPAEYMNDFAEALAEREMANEIIGVTADDNIKIKIQYDQEQRYEIFELSELVENDFDVD